MDEAFGRGDIPGVMSVFADDIEWHVPAVWNAFERNRALQLQQDLGNDLPFRSAKQLAGDIRRKKVGSLELLDRQHKEARERFDRLAVMARAAPTTMTPAKQLASALSTQERVPPSCASRTIICHRALRRRLMEYCAITVLAHLQDCAVTAAH